MSITGTPYTYWVCVDCFYTANGLEVEWTGETVHPHPDAVFYVPSYTPDPPLSRIPEGAPVFSGLMRAEHEDGCGPDDECECETRSFSRGWCDGCGSYLAGERHALTVWENGS